jgi:hypothetical protein
MQTTAPAPIPLRDLWPSLLLAAVAITAIYLMAFDQGEISRSGLWIHEVMHDGRHLLSLPCH